jgi:tryptophan synthase beta subunit
MKDIHSDFNTASLGMPPAIYAADTTPVKVDRQGYESLEILLDIAAGGITFSGTNKIEFVMTHSDDDVTYSNVTDDDVLGASASISNGIVKALVAAHAAETTHRFGYIGGKRYVKLLADFSGTHGTGTGLAAVALLGNPSLAPVADQG